MSDSSSRRHASPSSRSKHQRKVVVVEDTFQSANNVAQSERTPSTSTSSAAARPRQITVSIQGSDHSSVFSAEGFGATDAIHSHSPAGSNCSSQSSLLDAVSGAASLTAPPSSSSKILENLKRQITASAARLRELENSVKEIPMLHSDIDDLRGERNKLASDLLDQQKAVQSLKQRVTVLHEQNGQLAKVLQAEMGGSDQLVAMRNTLLASLAQLKQLQEQANSIQPLKSQIRKLEEENTVVKKKEAELSEQFLHQLPKGVSLTDYKSLKEENMQLKSANEKVKEECSQVRQHLIAVSASCDSLQKCIDIHESSQNQAASLHERIRQLETERDTLYREIGDLKFRQNAPHDVDAAHLSREVALLQQSKSQLESRMERKMNELRQQKERLALRLFEIEALNVKTHKYELEKEILELEQAHVKSEVGGAQSGPHSPGLDWSFGDSMDTDISDLSPESKAQILTLQQLRVHNEQSKDILRALITEKDELEERVKELTDKVKESGVSELEARANAAESRMAAADKRIITLEKERTALLSTSSQSSIVLEHERLKTELAEVKAEHQKCSQLQQQCSELEEKVKDHDATLRRVEKLKEDKQKYVAKQKESRQKLKSVVQELTGSVQLLQSFQSKCASQQKEIGNLVSDKQTLREECALLKARLEVMELDLIRSSSPAHKEEVVSALLTSESHAELLEVKKAHDALASQNEDLNLSVREKDAQIKQSQAVIEKLQSEREDLLKTANTTNHEVEQRTRSLEANKEELQLKLATIQKECEQALADKRKSDEALLSLQSEQENASQRLLSLARETAQKQEVNTQQAEKMNSLQSDLKDARAEIDRLVSERDHLQKQCKETKHFSSTLEGDLQAQSTKLQEITQRLTSLQQLCQELGHDLGVADLSRKGTTGHDSELTLLETVLQRLHVEVRTLVQERNRLSLEVEKQAKVHEEMEEARIRTTESLQSSQKALEQSSKNTASELKDKEAQLNESRRMITDLESTVAIMKKKMVAFKESEERESLSLQTELSECKEEIAALQLKLQESEKSFQENTERLRSINSKLSAEKSSLESSYKSSLAQLDEKLKSLKSRPTVSHEEMLSLQGDLNTSQKKVESLANEVLAYQATIGSLRRQLDEAETREVEHEVLKQKVRRLELALGDSSQLKVDNKTLLTMLQETVTHLPSMKDEVHQSLQDENLRLEQQVSVLSQWNDKQRVEIETLEQRMDALEGEKRDLIADIMAKEGSELENRQLKQELKEVEMEVNMLRRKVRTDLQEEMQVKLKTQSQILSVFNQHNTLLQKQVEELQEEVRRLGGVLKNDKPVSPPPMPDAAEIEGGLLTLSGGVQLHIYSDLQKEKELLKEKVSKLENELSFVQGLSAVVRRRSSIMSARSSVSLVPVVEDVQVSVPHEMLLPCSLLADELSSGTPVADVQQSERFETVKREWFSCMVQETLSAGCVQLYLTTLSRLSQQLLDLVICLQDEQGNTALHCSAAHGNWDAVSVFLKQKCCDPKARNKAGYTPLMLAATSGVDHEKHKAAMRLLAAHSDINALTPKDDQSALMLACSTGSLVLATVILEEGASINAQDKDGSTALMFACQNNHPDVVKLLLSACDVRVKDKDGLTALDISKKAGGGDVYSILVKHC